MFSIPSWLPFIVIAVIIFFLWLKAYRYQISETESDRQRLERNNRDI